jgi:hypothetical protein
VGAGVSALAVAKSKSDNAAPPPRVEILEEKRVGAFDTAVLKVNDAQALSGWLKWLKKWEYDFSPELIAWVEPYVKQGWIITAFKIANDNPDTKRVASTAVRMTFQTEKPFYPYREPEDQRPASKEISPRPLGRDSTTPVKQADGSFVAPHHLPAIKGISPRLLRVFFLGDKRVRGTLGDKDKLWPGKVVWANKVSAADREKLLEVLKLPQDTPPANWHLTEFEDHSTPRPGTDDVFFGPSDDQEAVERPPSIKFVSRPSDDTMGYALIAIILIPWARRRWRDWRDANATKE